MWADAIRKERRRTKWKYVLLLFALAAAALFGAVTGGLTALDFSNLFQESTDWMAFPVQADAAGAAGQDGFFLTAGGTLFMADRKGTISDTLETGEEALTLHGGAAYCPGERNLYLLGEHTWNTISVPGKILYATGGQSRAAVITSGSGYLTKTLLYDLSGQEIGQICLGDAAMVTAAVQADGTLAGLCLDQAGSWSLRYYDGSGTLLGECPLDGAADCRIAPCGEGTAVLTDQSLLFFSSTGETVGTYDLELARPTAWSCSEKGWAAFAYQRGSKTILKTVSMEGRELGKTQLDGPVRSVAVCGNTLYALDFKDLRVYDKACDMTEACADGARAAGMMPFSGGCWLWGSGEIKKWIHS